MRNARARFPPQAVPLTRVYKFTFLIFTFHEQRPNAEFSVIAVPLIWYKNIRADGESLR
jgi:hypothetical protein